MTLRHRLLLVYSIVVVLSMATVGAAVFELRHSRQIIAELQRWNQVVENTRRLKEAFRPASEAAGQPEQRIAAATTAPAEGVLRRSIWGRFTDALDQYRLALEREATKAEVYDPDEFAQLLAIQNRSLTQASEYVDDDHVRRAHVSLYMHYQRWRSAEGAQKEEAAQNVRDTLQRVAVVVNWAVQALDQEAEQQGTRIQILLVGVTLLTLLHVVLIAWLLRRWLLAPMEQLGRQVEALARDQPPPEPLLDSPQEMASLARALDQARQSLGELRRQLIEAERMTTIGQLATQLAHNLRNPLAAIRATAQLASRQYRQTPQAAERMGEIIHSVDRMSRWISGLMEAARHEPTPTDNADVVPTLQRVGEALAQELAAKEISLQLQVPTEGIVCSHNPDTLEQALIAMLVNAIEASPLGGGIVLRAEVVSADGNGRLVCRISVIDGGGGLPADRPERIFEFSYSTKQRGTGLGLALARQALLRQGGAAHAFNNPDGGATVYVELPLATASEGEQAHESPALNP